MAPLPEEVVISDPVGIVDARLSVGGHCRVRLAETPSTGFRWQYEIGEQAVLELLESRFVANGSGAGVGGKREFVFRGKNSGSSTIRFILARSWEAGSSIQELQCHVSVRSSLGETPPGY